MFHPIVAYFTFVLFIPRIFSHEEVYYWREYTGLIAPDAVAAGKDINGHYIYIGQAYVPNKGLIVTQIYPGVKHVYAEIAGINSIDKNIKILCGPEDNLYWMPVKLNALHLLLAYNHAVIGGHEDGYGNYYIGRISYQGETKVGKIVNSKFFFVVDGNTRKETTTCEILLYNANANVSRGVLTNERPIRKFTGSPKHTI